MLWQTTETRIKTEVQTWVLTARVVKASKQAATRVQWVTRAAVALWATRVDHPAPSQVAWVVRKTLAAPRAVPNAGLAAWVAKAWGPAAAREAIPAAARIRIWKAATPAVAAAPVQATQAVAEANVARAECKPHDCYTINSVKPCITTRLAIFQHYRKHQSYGSQRQKRRTTAVCLPQADRK